MQMLSDWWGGLICFAHEARDWNSMGLVSDSGKKRPEGAIRAADEIRNNPIHWVMPECLNICRTCPLDQAIDDPN
jgi:hypothetical protein